MNILEKIVAHKKQEVAQLKTEIEVSTLVKSPGFKRTPISLKRELLDPKGSGIIAEFKRQSPSKGIINDTATIQEVTEGYLGAGVSAQSILTDKEFFGGTLLDLVQAREINNSSFSSLDHKEPLLLVERSRNGYRGYIRARTNSKQRSA